MSVKEKMDIVLQIDTEIRKHPWFDFHVLFKNESKLIIAGSTDLIYYHTLEIIFDDVSFFSDLLSHWHTDASAPVFFIRNDKFVFKAEGSSAEITITAENISFNTDTVYYYDRKALKNGERIADFVKKVND